MPPAGRARPSRKMLRKSTPNWSQGRSRSPARAVPAGRGEQHLGQQRVGEVPRELRARAGRGAGSLTEVLEVAGPRRRGAAGRRPRPGTRARPRRPGAPGRSRNAGAGAGRRAGSRSRSARARRGAAPRAGCAAGAGPAPAARRASPAGAEVGQRVQAGVEAPPALLVEGVEPAPEVVALEDRDLLAVLRQADARRQAAHAGADDQRVVAHASPRTPGLAGGDQLLVSQLGRAGSRRSPAAWRARLYSSSGICTP